jgi:D-tyrosyl-tRNA(Tyr) deacylase
MREPSTAAKIVERWSEHRLCRLANAIGKVVSQPCNHPAEGGVISAGNRPGGMRALLQRVSRASVEVEGATVGSIGSGLLVLVGVGKGDTSEDAAFIAKRVLDARLWPDATGGKQWSSSVREEGRAVLLVSQFTLHASTAKPKPSFHRSAPGPTAQALFDAVVAACRKELGTEGRVATGVFGAMMEVGSVNSGPVSLWVDSANREDALWEEDKSGGAGPT